MSAFVSHVGMVGWLALFSLSGTGLGADGYVNPVLGSDANDGASAATAWKTLTHAVNALAASAPGPHALHLAAGIYSPSGGESFPLQVPASVRLVGTAGAELTGPATGLLSFISTVSAPLNAWSGAEGIALSNANQGVGISSWSGVGSPTLRELEIRDVGGPGVFVTSMESSTLVTGVEPVLERVRITNCSDGVRVVLPGGYLESCYARLRLVECRIENNAGNGVRLQPTGSSKAFVSLKRCALRANGGDGLANGSLSTINSPRNIDAEACLIADNGGCGVFGQIGMGAPGGGSMRVRDCTIAGNGLAGLRSIGQHSAEIENTILAGNPIDVDCQFPPTVLTSLASDGTLSGFPGCLSEDPLFVASSVGDYSLRWGSPCIDRATAPATARPDLTGGLRTLDGDLDTLGAPDLGALEFAPLRVSGAARPGGELQLDVWGPALASARLLLARAPLGQASSTPFGDFLLDRPSTLAWLVLPAGAQPGTLLRAVPDEPRLIGVRLSFQALIDSPGAPRGAALSNAVEWWVGP